MIGRVLPLLCIFAFGACDGGSDTSGSETAANGNGNGDGNGNGNGNGNGDGSGNEPEPEPEDDCLDGIDNDDDGLVDCLDDDCADVFKCTWPEQMSHNTDIFFDGYNDVECDLGFWSEYEDVPDCRTEMSSSMVTVTDGDLCPACDLTFAGPFSVDFDDCDDLTGDGNRPSEARFGFVFLSETERELWTQDGAGGWVKSITMTEKGGSWSYFDNGEIDIDYDYCQNTLTIGMLNVTLDFVDQ